MGCEGGGHPQVETRTLGGADARSRGTQEEEDGTSLEGSPGLPRGLGQTALSIWTALNELAQEEEAARSLRTAPWGPPGHAELPPPRYGAPGRRQRPPRVKPRITVPEGQTVWAQRPPCLSPP